MRKLFFVTVFSIVFFAFANFASAEKGEITKIAYDPPEVVALSDITINIGVSNTDNVANDYKLKILVLHEGVVRYSQDFIFDLDSKKGIVFSPSFTPRDIGEFQIIAKLYDKDEIELLDSEIIAFNSISEIGPFDLKVDLPAKIVRPNSRVPIILTLENKGQKRTDVELQVRIRCPTGDVKESFFLLLEANSFIERVIGLQSCLITGVYDVIGDVLLFNRTWISSTVQLIVNQSIVELLFDPPIDLRADAGKSVTFDVMVKNSGTRTVDNLKLIITRIPPEWIQITPSEIKNVKPNTQAYFLVNITVPQDVRSRLINFTFIVAGEDTQNEKRANFQVSGLATAGQSEEIKITPPAVTVPKISLPNIPQLLVQNSIYIFAVVGVVAAVVIGRIVISRRRAGWNREGRELLAYKMEKLKKNMKRGE